jgi:hypothetical protein
MLTFCGNALNPKSETFKFPNASRRRFSGYTFKKKKKKSRSQQAQSQNKELKKATKLPDISTFRSLWYTPLQ